MITKGDLERLMDLPDGGRPVLSLFLDLSVNSNNKRTHSIYLSQKRAQVEEVPGTDGQDPRALLEALDRAESWLDANFEEANRGVVIYTEVGGPWLEALQFPVPVQNRALVAPRPVVAPLAQVLESYRHYGVVLLDREHARLMSVWLGTLLDEFTVRGDPLPPPHDVQAGGYSQGRIQRRKVEELKHFFKDFAREVHEFAERWRPDEMVILGTDENVAKFREFLDPQVLAKVVYTGHGEVDGPASEIMARLEPHLAAVHERESREVLQQVRDRVAHDYLATAGFQGTLTALQEGKVDTLLLASDQRRDGTRCGHCGFVFARTLDACPYDGTAAMERVDVVEEMVRMAEGQGVAIAFADPQDVRDLSGAAALLRF
jgi:peptide chain release factor subunit 1